MKKLLALIAIFLIPFLITKTSKKSYTYNPSLDKYIKLARNKPKVSQQEILAEIAKEWGDLGYEVVYQAYLISKNESGFNPYAISKTGDFGLLQLHASTWCPFFKVIPEQLLSYSLNIKLAKKVYLRNGWCAWTTAKPLGLCN